MFLDILASCSFGSKPGWLKRQTKPLTLQPRGASSSEVNIKRLWTSITIVYIHPLNGNRDLIFIYIYIYIYISRVCILSSKKGHFSSGNTVRKARNIEYRPKIGDECFSFVWIFFFSPEKSTTLCLFHYIAYFCHGFPWREVIEKKGPFFRTYDLCST